MIEPTTPAARNTDPATSHVAAADVTASGLRAAQAAAVAAGVARHPGKTSRELAGLIGMDRHAVARRLSEVEALGHVRRGTARACTTNGRPALTWWPTEVNP